MQKKERNYSIDFLRGIASLCIILIHTAWWSGTSYLPAEFSNATLLIDVPVFIFISGMSFNYVNSIVKNLKSLLLQWKKWIYFLIFYTLILITFFYEQFHISDIFSWIVYVFPHSNNIEVVSGSIWFMMMYIEVTIICSIIICIVNKYCKKERKKTFSIIMGIILFIFLYCSTNNNFLFINSTLSFYSLIYLLGYILYNYKIKNFKDLFKLELINFLVLLVTFYSFKLGIKNIQGIKFSPSLAYLPFSMISIILFWYLKDHLNIKRNNKIVYIGKNAIFYYFAQGVSSSFIYYVYPFIPFNNIALKFICMLICNIICTTIGAIFLDKTYCFFNKKIKITFENIKFIEKHK